MALHGSVHKAKTSRPHLSNSVTPAKTRLGHSPKILIDGEDRSDQGLSSYHTDGQGKNYAEIVDVIKSLGRGTNINSSVN
mmetsp:Transcript_7224/g.11360  ORF Transcript_7224/g.11360 Transcript_7224/m.11360 type:complete len:80 (-) Transcript_7224:819-1058(-)|eukprot:CAMPEP_0170485834 /NCGR_PEP_ID=MMETSP0208-20121228/4997_1 /TAXON_ID=197538 /ORGANISM="Strombidium inclinatum, Strain S3" /LENGTH=79 /DNA_ID=CAMNT_0010759595 /DNA_START=333 /DNA_END=572 /DNA_ORIENTATION=+